MYNVRIKKNARAGDQKDFSLHSGLDAVYSPTSGVSAQSSVKHTMGASSRDEANIEVEGRETVVGDVNNDGYVELFEFKGKRHSKGGMPVNIPEGSFIFSDTKKLTIKDRALLKELFDKSGKKSGYTPAEISKQYKLNHFMATLRDEKADKISKGTADLMVKKNMRKLGELALVQESMKGFPTGIPAIAELAMGGGQESEPKPQMMRRGGIVLPRMNDGGGSGTAGKASASGQQSYASKLMSFIDDQVEKYAHASSEASWKEFEKKQQKEAKEAAIKEKLKSSSGNVALDKVIVDYQKNPTKEKARYLTEMIEKSYPYEKGLTDFGSWISGTGKYNQNKITGDSDFIREVYLDAHRKSKSSGLAVLSKDETMAYGTNKLNSLKSQLEVGQETLLPHEVAKLSDEIGVFENFLQKGGL